jgi:hypothetical protein
VLRLTCSTAGEYQPRVLVSVLRNQSRNVETSNIEFHESWDYRILNVLSNEYQRFLRQRQILAFRTEYELAISEQTQKSCYISWTVRLQYRVLISWGETVRRVSILSYHQSRSLSLDVSTFYVMKLSRSDRRQNLIVLGLMENPLETNTHTHTHNATSDKGHVSWHPWLTFCCSLQGGENLQWRPTARWLRRQIVTCDLT